jgi:DNA-binding NarL/FixJ family response regulator
MVRAGLRMILDAEADITVVGEAADGTDVVDLVNRSRPDVVLMDVRMPRIDGIEACRRVHDAGLGCRVLMLTTFDLDDHVHDALRAGASGFLLKDAPADDLVEAIRIVARGDALLAPSVTRTLIEAFTMRPDTELRPHPGIETLTEREVDVIKLMARGRSNAEIAGELYLGEATIKTHVGRILAKLGARDRVQAVVIAYESGVVVPGGSDHHPG